MDKQKHRQKTLISSPPRGDKLGCSNCGWKVSLSGRVASSLDKEFEEHVCAEYIGFKKAPKPTGVAALKEEMDDLLRMRIVEDPPRPPIVQGGLPFRNRRKH